MHITAGILGLASGAYALMIAWMSDFMLEIEEVVNEFGNKILGPQINAYVNKVVIVPGTPGIENVEVVLGILTMVGVIMVVWGGAAFARPSQQWCKTYLLFAVGTVPMSIAIFEGIDLILTIPAWASAMFAMKAAKLETRYIKHKWDRIEPTIGLDDEV